MNTVHPTTGTNVRSVFPEDRSGFLPILPLLSSTSRVFFSFSPGAPIIIVASPSPRGGRVGRGSAAFVDVARPLLRDGTFRVPGHQPVVLLPGGAGLPQPSQDHA